MTKKKQTTKTEVASEVKETSPVVTDTAAPVTPPAEPVAVTTTTATHGQAAEIHATEAKEKAVVAGDAAKEASSEAALAAKEKLSQAGEATAEATAQATEATKAGAQKAVDKTYAAGVRVADTTAVAKEKLTEAGESVQTGVQHALDFIKEHLPRVEHQEETPEERQSKALLDEAMGRPGDTSVLPSEVEVIQTKTRPAAEHLVAEGAILDQGGAPEPGPQPLGLPSELERSAEEDRSAKGLAEVMEEKATEAKEYLRAGSRRRPPRSPPSPQRPGSPSRPPVIHEYSALPGDIHIPLVKKALREHVLHRPQNTTTTTTTPATTTPDVPFSSHSSAQEIFSDAQRRASEATKTAEEKVSHAAHSVGESLSEAYHKVADPVTGALHTAEEKAKWTYEHTKDELIGKTAAETHQEMLPKNEYEAELAHGAIPSSTEEVLKGKLTTSSLEPSGPQTPSAASVRDAVAEDALAKSAVGYGEENLGAPAVDASDVVKTTLHQHHRRWSGLGHMEPGSEGEVPS